MATEAVAERAVPAPTEATAFVRPYPRGRIDVLFDAIDRAPVPAWSIYAVATLVSIVGSNRAC